METARRVAKVIEKQIAAPKKGETFELRFVGSEVVISVLTRQGKVWYLNMPQNERIRYSGRLQP